MSQIFGTSAEIEKAIDSAEGLWQGARGREATGKGAKAKGRGRGQVRSKPSCNASKKLPLQTRSVFAFLRIVDYMCWTPTRSFSTSSQKSSSPGSVSSGKKQIFWIHCD